MGRVDTTIGIWYTHGLAIRERRARRMTFYWEPFLWVVGGILGAWFIGLPLLIGWMTFLYMIEEDENND